MNLFFILSAAAASIASASVAVCSSADALVQDLAILTDPTNPKIGDSYNLTLTFTSPIVINDKATMRTKMPFDGFPVSNDLAPVCDSVNTCPLPAGPQVLSWVATVPTDVPSGQLQGSQTWFAPDSTQLFCYKWVFNL